MRLFLKNLALFTAILLVTSSETPLKEGGLQGTWKMVSGKNNGVPAPGLLADRRQEFRMDKTFESLINTAKGLVHGNGGLYFLPNDTTLITFHKDVNGKLSTIANTYFFRIKNDTLHLFGNYLAEIRENPALLKKVFIDEQWVRMKSK